ncbi:Superkiller protein 3 [Coemansia brasiliensis]|uniref:Superkiller protein 3 n=1 Tax=Coemansia brasiliensis TaxID=2650707 RepID=A0A9W8M0C6_9FUNG|nr:Superkiller protein 3 [Coemansia brasiliensis]
MSVIFKAKLKAAKTAISEKNYDYAYDLCHDLLELDESNYNVHILLGVSCQHLGKWTEGDKVYQRAMQMPKANILAWQGVSALYEASGDRDKYEHALRSLCDRYISENNLDKAWETMQKIIQLYETVQDGRKLVSILRELTAEGPYHILLKAQPTDSQLPPKETEIWERMYEVEVSSDERMIETETKKRKTRLGAGPAAQVRAEVRAEVFAQSGVLATLAGLVAKCIDDGDMERLLISEQRFFECLDDRLDVVEQRDAAVQQLLNLASDLVTNQRCARAYMLMIEMADTQNDKLSSLAEPLVTLFPDAPLAESMQLWQIDDSVDVDAAISAAKRASDSPFAQMQVVVTAARAREYRRCVDAAVTARRLLEKFEAKYGVSLPLVRQTVDLAAADAFMEIGKEHASDAEALYRSCLEADLESKRAALGLGLATCALGHLEEGQILLRQLVDTDPGNGRAWGGLGAVLLESGDIEEAIDAYQHAVSVEPEFAAHHAGLGASYWQMGGEFRTDKQYAFGSWLTAARLDPTAASVFGGLGKWYAEQGDSVRAQRCFVKAMSLDCTDSESGPLLADIYIRSGQDDLCEKLLIAATDACFSLPWAWRRLGFLLLRQQAYERAVAAFQNALSANRSDCVCWEGLCEAYLGIGRIHTAVKVARKIVDLDSSRVSGHWLSARACMQAHLVDKALEHFDRAQDCATSKSDLWARPLEIGRAECLVALTERRFTDGLFAQAAQASCEALRIIKDIDGEFLKWSIVFSACIWLVRTQSQQQLVVSASKEIAELVQTANQQLSELRIPQYLAEIAETAVSEPRVNKQHYGNVYNQLELAELAAQLRVLLAESTSLASTAWTDLGYVYYIWNAQFHESMQLLASKQSMPTALLTAAGNCAVAAIQLDANNSRAYNIQGSIAALAGNTALAQHAFIMATRNAPLSAMPWANLGFLYLNYGDVELANKAFARAQMLEPDFYAGWLGQAIIAEQLGSAECVDLYEACLLLEGVSTDIADIGYAQQVWKCAVERNEDIKSGCSRVLAHGEQNRLLLGIYAARRFVARSTDSGGVGSYLLGMLLEQNSEYECAVEAYSQALMHVSANDERRWTMLTSLARAQCSAEEFAAAVDTYAQAAALLEDNQWDIPTTQWFGFLLGRSLSLFFAQQLEESLGMFEQVLALTESMPEQRPSVGVMLAQVLWALGSDEHRQLARQHLVDTMTEHPDYSSGLATLFAIGMLSDDADLVSAAYTELSKLNTEGNRDLVRLESYLAILRNDPLLGRRSLSRALYKTPDDASLWLLAADFNLLCSRDSSTPAEAALRLFKQAVRGHHSWSSAPMPSVVNSAKLQVAVSALSVQAQCSDDVKCRKSAANKAIMYQPWIEYNWSLLK